MKITAKLSGYISIFGNIFLFAFKLSAGIVTGSVALIADAWHTLSDSVSSVILLAGIYISKKPADSEHPFGHGRAEIISSLILGLFLILIAINFFYDSVISIIEKREVEYGLFAIIVTAGSMISKEILAQIAFRAYKYDKIQSLKADGWHHRSDAFTSAIILIGIFLGNFITWIDGALGIFVSVLILILAYRIVIESINPLLGEKPEESIVNTIESISRSVYKYDLQCHHFQMHRYGNHTEITFHIKLPGHYKLSQANIITKKLREKIKQEMNIYSTIYIDSYKTET